jgi:hypothetical protein
MGYTPNDSYLSGVTCTDTIYVSWTKIGREYLIGSRANRKAGLTVSYFTLGDSDMNYLNTAEIINGFIPNVTGEDTLCLNGTSTDDITYKVNLNDNSQIIVKSFNIFIPISTNNPAGCTLQSLIYNIFYDGINIFATPPSYYDLFPANNVYTSYDQLNTVVANLQSMLLPEFVNNISFNYGKGSLNSHGSPFPFAITNLFISVVDLPADSTITDNSYLICNNMIQSTITFTQKIVVNPSNIPDLNGNQFTLPICN